MTAIVSPTSSPTTATETRTTTATTNTTDITAITATTTTTTTTSTVTANPTTTADTTATTSATNTTTTTNPTNPTSTTTSTAAATSLPDPPASSSLPVLPPLVTSPPSRRTTIPRPMSHASKNRLSQYSAASIPLRSRPTSHVFPVYPSSLTYTLVRDFAYPSSHPLHYGPPPEPSRPPSDLISMGMERRLSDPPLAWDGKTSWDTGSWAVDSYDRPTDIPPIYLADGPPWSEDEDLQSPVVSSRHRKHKSSSAAYGHGRSRSAPEGDGSGVGDGGNSGGDVGSGLNDDGAGGSGFLSPGNYERDRGYYVGTSGDGSERYYVNQGAEANGPGGEYVTYPPDQARHSHYQMSGLQPHSYTEYQRASNSSSPISSPDYRDDDQSRYSRDYQFTITSPDEEMHGKAVALFDFERENENELPLVEGQIIWVSYRHGQGWLVAMDPKTQESGLVPEEYVRLLRDIEGGMTSLTGQLVSTDGTGTGSPNDGGTPTQAEHQGFNSSSSSGGGGGGSNHSHTPAPSNASNGYHQPIVSTFSTSSKDLDPYPQHLLGTQVGQTPPQVVHYHGQRGGSQANTPTLLNHQDTGLMRRGSQDLPGKKSDSLGTLPMASLPDAAEETTTTGNAAKEEAYVAP